jgi:hypothetical protein
MNSDQKFLLAVENFRLAKKTRVFVISLMIGQLKNKFDKIFSQ